MNNDVNTLPQAEHDRWHQFIDGINRVVSEVFGTEDIAVVIGAQWGEMGRTGSNLPNCVVTSNLDVHACPNAVAEMQEFVDAQHEQAHGIVKEPMIPENVPEHVRQEAIAFAESIGLTEADIQFVAVDDSSDLSKLDDPLFSIEAEQESKHEE